MHEIAKIVKSNNDHLSINRYKVIQITIDKKKKKVNNQTQQASLIPWLKLDRSSQLPLKHFSNLSQHRTTVPLSALEIGTRSHVPLPEARFFIRSHREHIQTRSNRVLQINSYIQYICIYYSTIIEDHHETIVTDRASSASFVTQHIVQRFA